MKKTQQLHDSFRECEKIARHKAMTAEREIDKAYQLGKADAFLAAAAEIRRLGGLGQPATLGQMLG